MLFSSLFGRWTRGSKPNSEGQARRRTSPYRKAPFQPILETLEDRNLLSAGMLNPHFGTGGKAFINFGANIFHGNPDFAVTPDGMTVLTGGVTNPSDQPVFAVAELTKDGNLNPNFGTGGETIIPNTGQSNVIAVQPDGTIVLGGETAMLPGDVGAPVVAELNKDGTLKTSFGTGGVAILPIPTSITTLFYLDKLVVKPDGEIVTVADNFFGPPSPFMVAELTKDGKLNSHFGSGGETVIDNTIFGANTDFIPGSSVGNFFAPFNSLAFTSDGTIVVAGTVTDNRSNPTYEKIGVVELTKDGRLNDSFGQGGKVLVDFGPTLVDALFTNFVVNPDGTILLGATTNNSAQTIYDFSVAELTKDGSLNADFGAGGETNVDFGPSNFVWELSNIAVQPNGTIVLGGTISTTNTGPTGFGVAELTKKGHLKAGFGTGGTSVFDFGANYSIANFGLESINVAIQPDGTIVLASQLINVTTGQNVWGVAELTKDGNLNPDFGTGGETIVDFGPGSFTILSYAIVQPDGTIVLAGSVANPAAGVGSWAVAELSGNRHDCDHHWWDNDE
jgi:uncharacterized delta-60 repeat protein